MYSCKYRLKWQSFAQILLVILVLSLTACAGMGASSASEGTPSPAPTATPPPPLATEQTPVRTEADICPAQLKNLETCQTPHSMRVAYSMESLIQKGFTGKGQTIIDIVSYGSPTLQQDIDVFSKQFDLPAITVEVISPLGTVPYDPKNTDMVGWAVETTLDVEIIHAIAPDAGIVVLTSPVAETEGTIGMPEFLKLEQYAVDHQLGQIFSQSYVASEATLADTKGRKLVQEFADFYQKITTQQGWTVVSGSGDHGATDYIDLAATKFSNTPIVNFPADVPWITAVGGTSLFDTTGKVRETAWPGSGGGFSKFFSQPDYQIELPPGVQSQMKGQRGIPDIAANADPSTAMAIYYNGLWQQVGGTSASTPTWAGIIAIANQVAGRPLGFINPGLYKIMTSPKAATDFRDIVSGDNTFIQSGVTVQGFPAVTGWDPVTGNGAPVGDKLIPDLIAALSS